MAAWAHQVMIAVVAILLRILGFRDFRLVSLLENTSSTNSQNNCKHNVNSIWEQRPMQVPPTMPQSMGTKKMNEVPCSPWSMETVLQIGCCGRVATEVFSKPDAHVAGIKRFALKLQICYLHIKILPFHSWSSGLSLPSSCCFVPAGMFQNMAVETCQSRQSEWLGWNLPDGHIPWNLMKQCWFQYPSCRLCVTFRHCTSFPGIAPTYLEWQLNLMQNAQKKRICLQCELKCWNTGVSAFCDGLVIWSSKLRCKLGHQIGPIMRPCLWSRWHQKGRQQKSDRICVPLVRLELRMGPWLVKAGIW